MEMSWGQGPEVIRLISVVQFVFFLIASIWIARSARRLYSFSRRPINPDSAWSKGIDPEVIVRFALAGRLPNRDGLKPECDPSQRAAGDRANSIRALRMLDMRFQDLWRECKSDVDSATSASLVMFFLSLLVVAYGAYPTFSWYFNDTNRTAEVSLFWTMRSLLRVFSRGCLGCTLLYFLSSLLDRTLKSRRRLWSYSYRHLMSQLREEQQTPDH